MTNVSKPNTFSASTTISSSQVNANFDTIYNDYNGSIDATNLATGAVTTAKIADSNVTTAKIADSNVTTAKLAAGAVTNAKLDTTAGAPGGAWASWTPTWTGLTVGNGTNACAYMQIGKTVFFRVQFTLGSTSAITGSIKFTLPVTSISYVGASQINFGNGILYDSSAGAFVFAVPAYASTTTSQVNLTVASGTYTTVGVISSTVPFTWATGDTIGLVGQYEAA